MPLEAEGILHRQKALPRLKPRATNARRRPAEAVHTTVPRVTAEPVSARAYGQDGGEKRPGPWRLGASRSDLATNLAEAGTDGSSTNVAMSE